VGRWVGFRAGLGDMESRQDDNIKMGMGITGRFLLNLSSYIRVLRGDFLNSRAIVT
jgi:hypothetical protein